MHRATDQSQNEYTQASWLSHTEGQLAVDVLETPREIIVRSAIAGVNAEDLDITIHEDTLTIRGNRSIDNVPGKHIIAHATECHWGSFSRSIILPSHVNPNAVDAVLKKGVLTIRLKKIETGTHIDILELDDTDL